MDVFVTYDAVREHAFICFQKAAGEPNLAGYLDEGLYVEFNEDDQAELQVLAVDHPFYARSPEFGDRFRQLIGATIAARLHKCDQEAAPVAEEISVSASEVEELRPAWQAAISKLHDATADPLLAGLSRPAARRRQILSTVIEQAGKWIREWHLPVLLDPVVAREALVDVRPEEAVTTTAFSGIVELPPDLTEVLQADPMARVDIGQGVLRLRILLQGASAPPPLMVEVTGTGSAAQAVASGGELSVRMPVDQVPTSTGGQRRVGCELRFWIDEERQVRGG
jgi:hypothetical protein